MAWNVLLKSAETVVLWFANSCEVKRLVVKLLERYVEKTDNDVDNMVVELVRGKLLVNCDPK